MSRTRIIPLITLVTAIGTLPARAADEGKAWTLHDCMAYAVEHSPRSKIQELTNANTDRDHLAAIMNFLPYISGSVGANANFGRSLDPETNTYTAQNNFNNSYSVSGSLPLFNGFKVVNNLRIAKIARLQGAENLQLINDEIALETMQAYADVHYYRGMVNLAGEQLAESKNTLYQAKVQEELGLKGNADVLEIEAKVASEDFNLTRQQNLYADAMLKLKEAMFYPIGDTLPLDTTQHWAMAPLAPHVPADSIYRTATDFLPKARIAQLDFQTAMLNFRTAKWQLLPSLSLSGGVSTSYSQTIGGNAVEHAPFRQQFKDRVGKYVSVGLNIPIFKNYSQQITIAKQRNLIKISDQEQKQTLHEIESEIQRAVQDMEGTAKEYIQCTKQVIAQEMAYKAMRRKYEEGLASVIDLQTSSNQLLVAKAAKLNALLQYLIKKRVVDYYKGTPYLEQDY